MAASAGKINVKDFLMKVGGTSAAFATGATINLTSAVTDAPPRYGDGNYRENTKGIQSYTVEVPGLLDREGALAAPDDLALTVGGKALCLEGASVTISVGMQTITSTCGGAWQEVRPNIRGVSISGQGFYFDPNATGTANDAFETTLDEVLGVTNATEGLSIVLSFGSVIISGTFRPSSLSIGGTIPDVAKAPVQFESYGDVAVDPGDIDTVFSALLQSVFNGSGASSAVSFETGPATTGSAKYTGSGYVSSINITIPVRNGASTMSTTIMGNGALTEGTVS